MDNKLFEIVEYGDDGWRIIRVLGTIYAQDETEARQGAADYFKNPEIATTGFYGVQLPDSTIKPQLRDIYWRKMVRDAENTIKRNNAHP